MSDRTGTRRHRHPLKPLHAVVGCIEQYQPYRNIHPLFASSRGNALKLFRLVHSCTFVYISKNNLSLVHRAVARSSTGSPAGGTWRVARTSTSPRRRPRLWSCRRVCRRRLRPGCRQSLAVRCSPATSTRRSPPPTPSRAPARARVGPSPLAPAPSPPAARGEIRSGSG